MGRRTRSKLGISLDEAARSAIAKIAEWIIYLFILA
jgi:hypothetical protein